MVDDNQWSAHHSDEPPCFQKKRRKGQTKSNMSKPQSNDAQCILWFWVFDNNLKKQTTTTTKEVVIYVHQQHPSGGALNKCLYGETPPRGPTTYHFLYHFFFSRKRYPFRIPSIEKWCPFHIPCLEVCIPFNCTVLWIGINHKTRTFSRLCKAIQFIC